MRHVALCVTIGVLCLSCAHRAEMKRGGVISDVQCLAIDENSGKYKAWTLSLLRTVESGNDRDLPTTYLTSVGSDPTSLTVHYKKLESGTVYLLIEELDSIYAIEMNGEVRYGVRRAEYDSVSGESTALPVISKYSIEVEERQFPLLPPRLLNTDANVKAGIR